MKVVARGHIDAPTLWIRLRISTAGKSEFAQVLTFAQMPFLVHERSGTHLIPWWFLGGYEITPKQHLNQFNRFFVGLALVTVHGSCYMCSSRLHPMLCNVMRPKSYFAAPSPAHQSLLMTDVSYAHFHSVLLLSGVKGGWSCLQFQFEAILTAYLNYYNELRLCIWTLGKYGQVLLNL